MYARWIVSAIALTVTACAPAATTTSTSPTSSGSAVVVAPSPSTATPGTSARSPRPVPAARPSDLVVRLAFSGDTGGPVPYVVLTADGRLLTRTDANELRERKLTPAGVQRIRDELEATGLFEKDQSFPLTVRPGAVPPARGVGALHFRAWQQTRTVEVQTANHQGPDEVFFEPSAARTRLDRLSAQLRQPESWLPADAWADPTSRPYDASNFALLLRSEPGQTNVPVLVPALVAAWPFSVGPLAIGQTLPTTAGIGADTTRCTVLTRDDMLAVREAVLRAGARDAMNSWPDGSWVVGFAVQDRSARLVLGMQPLLPDVTSCDGVTL